MKCEDFIKHRDAYINNLWWCIPERAAEFISKVCGLGITSLEKLTGLLSDCIKTSEPERLAGLTIQDISLLAKAWRCGETRLVRSCVNESWIKCWAAYWKKAGFLDELRERYKPGEWSGGCI